MPSPCGVMEIAQLLPGVMQTVVVTVPQFKISWGVYSRLKRQYMHLLPFWQMDPSSPGVMQRLAVTVRQFEISSVVCSRFRPQIQHLLRFWQTNPSLPGVTQTKAVTVQKWEISSEVCGRFRLQRGAPSSRLLHLDVLGAPRALCWQKYRVRRGGKLTGHSLASCIKTCSRALGLCADNSTGCELEKHVRRLVGSLPWGFALSILQTKWSCVSKIDSSTSLQGSCLALCCSVSPLSWSPKLASSRLAFRLSNTGFAKSIHIYNAVLCGLAP